MMKRHNAVLQTQYLIHIPKATPHIHGKLNKCQLHQNSIWQAHETVRYIFPFPNFIQTASTEIERMHQSQSATKVNSFEVTRHTREDRAPIRLCAISTGPLWRADVQNCIWTTSVRIYTQKQKIKWRRWNSSQGRKHSENWIWKSRSYRCCPLWRHRHTCSSTDHSRTPQSAPLRCSYNRPDKPIYLVITRIWKKEN